MCLLDDYSFHELQLAACFLVASIAMVVYHRRRPGIRPNVMRMGFAISLLGAATLLAIALFFSPSQQPAWAQSLTNAFRILPFLAVLAYICRLTGTNQGTKSPILGAFCRSAPLVLSIAWLSLVVLSLVYPSTYIGDSPAKMSHFWVYKLLNSVEFSYLVTSAVIFGREAIRRREIPSPKLRIQHSALFFGSFAAAVGVIAAAIAAAMQAYPGTPISETPMPAFAIPVQLVSISIAAVFYLIGLFIHHSNEENRRIHARLRKWIMYRHDLEVEFDSVGNIAGNRFTDRYFRKASDDETIKLSPAEKENAAYTVKLLGHLSRSPNARTARITHLRRLHSELASVANVASRLLVRVEGNISYDLRQDSLYAAMIPALILAQEKASTNLLAEKDWVQLAAVTAADAGYLPTKKADSILCPNRNAVKGRILKAYIFAKLTEEDL